MTEVDLLIAERKEVRVALERADGGVGVKVESDGLSLTFTLSQESATRLESMLHAVLADDTAAETSANT